MSIESFNLSSNLSAAKVGVVLRLLLTLSSAVDLTKASIANSRNRNVFSIVGLVVGSNSEGLGRSPGNRPNTAE